MVSISRASTIPSLQIYMEYNYAHNVSQTRNVVAPLISFTRMAIEYDNGRAFNYDGCGLCSAASPDSRYSAEQCIRPSRSRNRMGDL